MINIDQRKQMYCQHEEEQQEQNQEGMKSLGFKIKCVFVAGLLLIVLLFVFFSKNNEVETLHKITKECIENPVVNVSTYKAKVSKYFTYGTHFNLKGWLYLQGDKNIKQVSLTLRQKDYMLEKDDSGKVLKSSQIKDIEIPVEYKVKKGKITYKLAKYIDKGMNLEEDTIKDNEWFFFLTVTDTDNMCHKYLLEDESGESPIEYYTVTRGGSNQRVNIDFKKYGNENTMVLTSKKGKLPDEVYDMVVDAGHGGTDTGATACGYMESQENLRLAKKVAKKLQEYGYKVALTRDGSEDSNVNTAYTMYDDDGRVNVACRSKAKIGISVHENSTTGKVTGGTEVYCSIKTTGLFAKEIADQIVNKTNGRYSDFAYYKVFDGSYQRAFSKGEVAQAKRKAKAQGYSYYASAGPKKDYYFWIRELGGIATGAMMDGRNKDYGVNQYMNSNQGVESVIVESGYICVKEDADKIHKEVDTYAEAIATAVDKQVK